MLRLLLRRPRHRRFSSEPLTAAATAAAASSVKTPNHLAVPPPSPHPASLPTPQSLPPSQRRIPVIFLSAFLLSGAAVTATLLSSPDDLDETLEKSKASVRRVVDRMGRTAAAATALWRSLASVLSSVDQEVRSGFELRVAALLADIAAASGARRAAIVGAGGGAVVDWLLESVAVGNGGGAQAEAARALAYLVSDPEVAGDVIGRPRAVPHLLKFIFSFQPKKPKKQFKHKSLGGPDLCKGRSMLVAAIMDIITSNCDHNSSFQPLLTKIADMRDIAAAIGVIEEGGMHFDEQHVDDVDDDGGSGMRGIGIKILGDATVVGLSRTTGVLNKSEVDNIESTGYSSRNVLSKENTGSFPKVENLTAVAVPGLWDDLQREHVAVPFAAWALANWALASDLNRAHIQELDRDGHAVMSALTAPERTVKWHGSLVARALLSDQNLPLNDSVPDWSSSLLSTAFQASKVKDLPLAHVALSAFLVAIERSTDAKFKLMESGLDQMREMAKKTLKHRHLQETIATVIELLYAGDMHFSFQESQKWSSILLNWVFGEFSFDTTRLSAVKILSCILDDFGPNSIPISQGWLAIMLTEILGTSRTTAAGVDTPIKTDKVKTQIDQSNALSAAQVASHLADAVVKLAGTQLGSDVDSVDASPLADFLSLESFSAQSKNLNRNSSSKFDAADAAFATLKGIKALAELCSEDTECKNKLADFGMLCLLRRFLLNDDYEKLASMEAYDASRVVEIQDRVTNSADSTTPVSSDPSSVRVPPTAHIRRHAARLLMVLSLVPNVKGTISTDRIWCKWLEDCASGKDTCCNDLKIRSYSKATLLNIFWSGQDKNAVIHNSPDKEGGNQKIRFPHYEDMIFLINPELPHWSCSEENGSGITLKDMPSTKDVVSPVSPTVYGDEQTESNNDSGPDGKSWPAVPSLDVVFVHGLRGGPFKSWRIADDKSSTTSKSRLVEKIDQEAGKLGTFWPSEWLAADFPEARLFTVKYKTNLTQWSGASLPLQEVSSMLLQKLVDAGIGNRPVVFVTHSMGGLVVKQMLYQAKKSSMNKFVNNTIGVVFYSCPHFGSKLADMPWRMGLILRPAPSIGELRSGSPRLVELNDFIRHLHNKGILDVLSFSETQVTPIVEGYGGWAFRMEIVPIESANPGFGELVVLDATDHINSCKPVSRTDPSYAETLDFLNKLKAQIK